MDGPVQEERVSEAVASALGTSNDEKKMDVLQVNDFIKLATRT